LAVFSGTFPLSGVEAVVGATEMSMLDVLDSLVAQSLVVPSVDSGRYRLLETVRLYALDQLIAADEVTAARDHHLEWILAVAGFAHWPARVSEMDSGWQDEFDKLAEIDNIVAAMEWADQNSNPDAALDLFRGCMTCWISSGALAPEMVESFRIMQLPVAARPLTALGRYGEALDIIETDFGPMLDAQHHNLRLQQVLGLTIVLHGLDQIERRDRLAAISLKLTSDWLTAPIAAATLVEIFGTDEAVATLSEPDPTELTNDRVTALISDTITEIRDLIARRASGPRAEAPTKAI
jgi:hypothetical protein